METADKKLKALEKLQKIDSRIDEILKIRGDLPEEVQDLEDEIAGFNTRIEKFKAEIKELEQVIDQNKKNGKEAERLIEKYTGQQNNVRNNREYDALTKEIELQELEIQVCEKRTRDAYSKIEHKGSEIEKTTHNRDERIKDLDNKKDELLVITKETEEEEVDLKASREKACKSIEERLLLSYHKIRKNARNGLAVVKVERNACGGCFNMVPPQRQADIRERKKLIVCEHCGRILSNVIDVVEPETKPKRKGGRKKAAK